MDFEKYYNGQFKTDILKFFVTIPDNSRFHEGRDKQFLSIQYERLTHAYRHLDFLTTKQDIVNFGVALFFTILIDEVFYTYYYREDYKIFQQLTRYPKFIGNCLSWCRIHLHPNNIFLAMNSSGHILSHCDLFLKAIFDDTFFEAIPIIIGVEDAPIPAIFDDTFFEDIPIIIRIEDAPVPATFDNTFFEAIPIRGTRASHGTLTFDNTFFEAIPIMERKTKDFFGNYIPTINGQEFWNRCISEFQFPFKPIEKRDEK